MATKKKIVTWPKVNKGTHLTVYTFEDGKIKLEWDDEALLSEVRNAILKHESTIPTSKKPKKLASVVESVKKAPAKKTKTKKQ